MKIKKIMKIKKTNPTKCALKDMLMKINKIMKLMKINKTNPTKCALKGMKSR